MLPPLGLKASQTKPTSNCVKFQLICISPKNQRGFTLLELLIVAIILAVIAAIVVPQLSAVSSDAQESAIKSNLRVIRSAINYYVQQHNHYPGSVAADGASCPASGVAGKGDASNASQREKAFASQLTMYTNAAGQACSTKDANFRYGPYLKVAQTEMHGFPVNPITSKNKVEVVVTGDMLLSSAATNGGWKYDAVNGKFIADHTDFDHF